MTWSNAEQHQRLHVRGWTFAVWALCVAGAVARIAAYSQNRSLWYDEAALALNLARRSYVGLLAPLDNLQTAPPLFLWAERAAVTIFGLSEWSLRAIPLAAGIAAGPLMWRVARRVLPPSAAVLAVALVTLSPSLVRYAAEAKPYGVDALVTLLVLDRAVAVRQPSAVAADWWALTAVGIAALVASTPAAFVLVGVIAFLLVHAASTRNSHVARRAIALCAGWAATLILLFATVFRPMLGDNAPVGKFMHWYWAANFLTPGPPGLATKVPVMLWAMLTETFVGAGAPPGMTTLLVAGLAVGCVMLVATRRMAELALIAVSIGALVFASALRVYPIAGRLVLFAAPLSALTLASSLLVFVRRDGRVRSAWLSAVPVACVAILAVRGVVAQLRSDEERKETRALVSTALRRHSQGTPVWVSGGSEPAWRFYSGQFASSDPAGETGPLALPDRSIAPGILAGDWYNNAPEYILTTQPETAADAVPSAWSEHEVRRLREVARPCVLLLFSQTQPGESASLLDNAVRLGGRVTQSWHKPGAALYEVCFAASPGVASQ